MSEWGNPSRIAGYIMTILGEVKYLSSQRKRNRKEIPLVVTSERGVAQTLLVQASRRC